MTERQMERVAIIEQIIGNIESCDETNSDKRALQNLELAEEVIIRLIEILVRNSEDNSSEFSVQEIRKESIKILKYIQEMTQNISQIFVQIDNRQNQKFMLKYIHNREKG